MMEGSEAQKSPESREISLDSIRNECLDAAGFVVFVGVLSKRFDKDGNNLIDFRYIRERFSFDDTKKAIKEFKEAFERDVESS